MFAVATKPEQQGVAYPMTFVLDPTGRVERKIVEANYRIRYGGQWLLEDLVGGPVDDRALRLETAKTGPLALVTARALLAAPAYFAFQRLGLHVELGIASGWHIYGPQVPPGYSGLRVDVRSEPEGVRVGELTWPPTTPWRVAGLDEEFAVYDGAVAIRAPLEFRVPRSSGVVRLEIAIGFQTCSATECLPPNAIALLLDVPEAPVP